MNMSYCQFENTMNDLSDCLSRLQRYENFQDFLNCEDLNESEVRSMRDMKDLCEQYLAIVEDSNFEVNKDIEKEWRKNVTRWMKENIAEHESSITIMVETCVYDLELPDTLLDNPEHWVWEIASDIYDESFPID